jgi:hypothetical protein
LDALISLIQPPIAFDGGEFEQPTGGWILLFPHPKHSEQEPTSIGYWPKDLDKPYELGDQRGRPHTHPPPLYSILPVDECLVISLCLHPCPSRSLSGGGNSSIEGPSVAFAF